MDVQYTEVYETKDIVEVEILIADNPDLESASSYIEMKVPLPKQGNPLLAEVLLASLKQARETIDEKIAETEQRIKKG